MPRKPTARATSGSAGAASSPSWPTRRARRSSPWNASARPRSSTTRSRPLACCRRSTSAPSPMRRTGPGPTACGASTRRIRPRSRAMRQPRGRRRAATPICGARLAPPRGEKGSVNPPSERERLIVTVADLLRGVGHVAVGASSPIPAAGAMLRRALDAGRGGRAVRISILGSARHNFFTNGSAELFDCAAQGRIDAFFLGGGQIDGEGNINLVGAGGYPRSSPRWPGSFGSGLLYYVVPRVILFREEHSPRVFVDKVDFISAAGTSAPGVHRTGGPYALVTGLARFRFDRARRRFVLSEIHPEHGLDDIRARTGFTFDCAPNLRPTPEPDRETLALIRGRVFDGLAESYPQFVREVVASGSGQ